MYVHGQPRGRAPIGMACVQIHPSARAYRGQALGPRHAVVAVAQKHGGLDELGVCQRCQRHRECQVAAPMTPYSATRVSVHVSVVAGFLNVVRRMRASSPDFVAGLVSAEKVEKAVDVHVSQVQLVMQQRPHGFVQGCVR